MRKLAKDHKGYGSAAILLAFKYSSLEIILSSQPVFFENNPHQQDIFVYTFIVKIVYYCYM